jgi:hypothetical protein
MDRALTRRFRGTLRIVESSPDYLLMTMVARAEMAQGPPPGAVPSGLTELMYGQHLRIEIATGFSR